MFGHDMFNIAETMLMSFNYPFAIEPDHEKTA